jgi:ATP-binding cassette, subfamily F, member 3
MLDKVVPIEAPPERKRIHFTFPVCAKSGRSVLELHDVRKAYGQKVIFSKLNLLIERGDRIALVGPNGAGKSTLMRMLSGVETPDAGTRREGHQVVMQYFAQDEATRLNPALSVYETMSADSPTSMVPAIRNILGGFLFSGDDVYKKASVLSGGERTRLAVARMLLIPSNTLLLDEPTNHLDLDSKDILLEALEDYGGTLIFVSHDRYFVERLATKIVEIGHGDAVVYPGTYKEFLYSKAQRDKSSVDKSSVDKSSVVSGFSRTDTAAQKVRLKADTTDRRPAVDHAERKRQQAEQRRRDQGTKKIQAKISDLEARIAEREQAMKEIEATMSAPGFYENREQAQVLIDRHQTLMWELGELMHQWEELSKTGN